MENCRRFVVAVVFLGFASAAAAQGRPDVVWMRGGHSSYITQMVTASDGTFFASAGSDRTIKIWRPSDGMLLRTLIIPGGSSAVALSPDNTAICAGGSSPAGLPFIRCWRVADGSLLWQADPPGPLANDYVSKLTFSPDGQRLAAAVGARIHVWNAADGSYAANFSGAAPSLYAGGLAYSPDGQFLGVNTAGDFPRLALLNAATGSLAWDYGGASVSFGYDVAFSPDSQLVASVNGAGLHVFGTTDHLPRAWTPGALTAFLTVAFSPNGARLAAGYAYSGALDLWNTATGALVRQWDAHGASGSPPAVTFSANSTSLFSGNLDIKRWKASDGSLDALVTGHVGPVWLLALSANEQVVATATSPRSGVGSIDEHVISLFRASDGALLRYVDFGSARSLRGLALSPDGHHVAAADDAGLRVWNVDTGVLERTHAEAGGNSYYRPLAYTPDGKAIAESGSSMAMISLWNPTTDTLTPIVAGPATVLRFLPSPDGRLVVAQQNPVAPPSVVEIVTLAGHVDRQMFGLSSVTTLAVSPNGQLIAAGGVDGAYSPAYVARIFRVSDGAPLQTLVGHANSVNGVAFSWDSQTVVSGGQDSTVRIWRVSDGTQLHLYDSETYTATPFGLDGVSSVVASTQSGRFLYGRGDGTAVDAVNPEAEPTVLTFAVPTLATGGCKPATGKVVLDRPAPPHGLTVSLASTSPTASVPGTLTFKGGAASKSFKITTSAVGTLENATIRATLDGETSDRLLGIRPIGIASLTLSPLTVKGGASTLGAVSLECNAGPGDIVVSLSSSIPSAAQPIAGTLTIPHGTKDGAFTVTTVPVTATKKPTIKAATAPDALSKSKKLVVNP